MNTVILNLLKAEEERLQLDIEDIAQQITKMRWIVERFDDYAVNVHRKMLTQTQSDLARAIASEVAIRTFAFPENIEHYRAKFLRSLRSVQVPIQGSVTFDIWKKRNMRTSKRRLQYLVSKLNRKNEELMSVEQAINMCKGA